MRLEALKIAFNESSGRLRAVGSVATATWRRQKMRSANVTSHILNGRFVIQGSRCLV